MYIYKVVSILLSSGTHLLLQFQYCRTVQVERIEKDQPDGLAQMMADMPELNVDLLCSILAALPPIASQPRGN